MRPTRRRMSIIKLEVVKQDLRVIHDADDDMLQRHLDASEREAIHFMNLTALPMQDVQSSDPDGAQVEPDVVTAVAILVRGKYEAASASEIDALRRSAETLLMPYRVGLGV